MFERARANAKQRAASAILGCNFANICSLTTTYSLGCAAFLRLALLAIGFGPSGRCCLADKIALDFPASDLFPKSGLWRSPQKCIGCAISTTASSLTSGMN
jgi:hypothetical protein